MYTNVTRERLQLLGDEYECGRRRVRADTLS